MLPRLSNVSRLNSGSIATTGKCLWVFLIFAIIPQKIAFLAIWQVKMEYHPFKISQAQARAVLPVFAAVLVAWRLSFLLWVLIAPKSLIKIPLYSDPDRFDPATSESERFVETRILEPLLV